MVHQAGFPSLGTKISLFSALAILLCGVPLFAQVTGSSIIGVITDPKEAPISDADVTITNTRTGVSTTTKTNTTGYYEFPPVNAGSYDLTVLVPGFSRYVRKDFDLTTSQRLRVDVQLQIATATQSVQVEGSPTVIDTETAKVAHAVEGEVIANEPIRGRNSLMITRLVPGGNTTFGADLFSTTFDTFAPSDISFNGTPVQGTSIMLNGVVNQYGNGPMGFSPPPDSLQEVNVQTFVLSAEYGQTSGSVIAMETRSGTNTVHGELYEFHVNPALNANDFFGNATGAAKAKTILNQFGGQLAGPVIIPRVYHGKDRTFIFGNYEGIHELFGYRDFNTVPTALERTGDFSQTTTAAGRLIAIYNPFTTRFDPNNPNTLIRSPFPNNVIPPSMINPVAKNLLNFYPLPNLPGHANNFLYSSGYTEKSKSYLFRVDHQVTRNNRLSGTFGSLDRTEAYDNNLPTTATGWNYVTDDQIYALSDTHVFSPTLILNVNAGVMWDRQPQDPRSSAADVQSLGFPASFTSLLTAPAHDFPSFSGQDLPTIGSPTYRRSFYTPDLRAGVTKIVGSHSLTMGYEYRLYRANITQYVGGAGTFVINRDWTQGPIASVSSANAGFSAATLLLGLVSTGSVTTNANSAAQTLYHAGYIQDNWRVHSRLTLNLGLRYDYETPTTERYNRMNDGFDFDTPSPIADAAAAAYAKNPIPELPALKVVGGLKFVGTNGNSRYNSIPIHDNLMPRFGLAWQVLPNRLVLRAGYGLFYMPLRNTVGNQVNQANQPMSQLGFSSSTSMVTALGALPLNTLTNPFPQGLVPPVGSSLGLSTLLGQTVTVVDSNLERGRTHQFQFGGQYELPAKTLLDIAYVGSRSNDLQVNRPLNGTPVQFLSLGDQMSKQVPNPFFGLISTGALSLSTVSQGQLLNAYPQYTGLTLANSPIGDTWYNSLQATLDKRFRNGFSMLGSYTWSKSMQELGYLYFSLPLERVISPLDRTHRLVVSGQWDVPVGKGRSFGSGLPKPLLFVIGNWETTFIVQYATGQPVGGWVGAVATRAPQDVSPTIAKWFDTGAFAPLPPFTVPTLSSRSSQIRADSTKAVDLTLAKEFHIHDRLTFRLQGQFYNLLNTPQFDVPNTTVTSPAFGTVTSQANQPRWIQVSGKIVF